MRLSWRTCLKVKRSGSSNVQDRECGCSHGYSLNVGITGPCTAVGPAGVRVFYGHYLNATRRVLYVLWVHPIWLERPIHSVYTHGKNFIRIDGAVEPLITHTPSNFPGSLCQWHGQGGMRGIDLQMVLKLVSGMSQKNYGGCPCPPSPWAVQNVSMGYESFGCMCK